MGRSEHRLIVYGSLAPGRVNHGFLASLEGTWTKGSITGDLSPSGWGAALGFPALRWRADGPRVDAWLFESPGLPSFWRELDEFEGEAYRRVLAPFSTDDGRVVVGYVYTDALDPAARRDAVK